MTRNAALTSLSHDHHRELVHAHRLRKAAAGDAEARLAAADAYVTSFFSETIEHFRREEEELYPLYLRRAGATPLLERILREHMQLHGLARALRAEVAAGAAAAETLSSLGELLHDHVRLEERELFAEIERIVPDAELATMPLPH